MRSLLLLTAVAACFAAGCTAHRPPLRVESPYRDPETLEVGQILHLPTGVLLTQAELLDYLEPFPVVYVGETHDNAEDHGVELTLLRELSRRHPVALGMEMLRRPAQDEVDAYLRGELSDKEFLRVWQKNWGPHSWPYYREILEFARAEGIPVVALNAGKDLMAAVRDEGPGGLEPGMAERLPEMDLDEPYQRAFVEGIFAGHEAGTAPVEGFYRVQVLWDETMAQTAASYLESPEGRERQLLIFAGGNHVRYGFGIPRRLFRRVPAAYAIVTPVTVEMPPDREDRLMDVDLPELPMRPADVYWAVGYEGLEDRQVMLGVQIEDGEGGVLVKGVMPQSPAAEAGLREGDLIVSVDGEPVAEVFDLTYQVGLHEPGDRGPVEILRDGERLTLEVTYDVVRHGR